MLQPTVSAVQLDERPRLHTEPGPNGGGRKRPDKDPDFYANVGSAVRTLREDIPLLFQKDLNCALLDAVSCTLHSSMWEGQRCSSCSAHEP